MCLLAMHTLICVTFYLPPGIRGWLLVALPGLFCLPFFMVFTTERFVLVLSCFFSHFSIVITSLVEEGAGLCAARACVFYFASVNCVLFLYLFVSEVGFGL